MAGRVEACLCERGDNGPATLPGLPISKFRARRRRVPGGSGLRRAQILLVLAPFAAQAQTHDIQMMGDHPMAMSDGVAPPKESGLSAFAAIQEIIALLEADPNTGGSMVDIEALRQHLIDMDNVTLRADAKRSPSTAGCVQGRRRGRNPRLDPAHDARPAATMNGVGGRRYVAVATSGADLTVYAPAKDLAKLKALGFLGVMTRGMHQQRRHLMIARGEHPH